MAARLTGSSLDSLVQTAYQSLYFRVPDNEALQLASQFVDSYEAITPEPEMSSRMGSMADGQTGLALSSEQPVSVEIPAIESLQQDPAEGDITIEAIVMLHSLYPDASVRTIATNWTGAKSDRGWSLGVTSTKSAYKPRNLILQLIGSRESATAKPEYEVVASNLRLELNQPYYVAVSIDLDDTTKDGIQFYLQNLAQPDAEPQVAGAAHQARWNVHSDRAIQIGGRQSNHRWDGLIQRLRLHRGALTRSQLLEGKDGFRFHSPEQTRASLLADVQLSDEEQPGRDLSGHSRNAVVRFDGDALASPQERARAALLHAYLCSNETIYVD